MTEEPSSSYHPPLPPTSEDTRFNCLRLLRSRRVGIATYYRLLADHGSVNSALEVLPEVARKAGVASYEICPEWVVHAELNRGKEARATLIFRGEPSYPRALEALDDPPPLLWCLGDPTIASRPCIAIVGARNASALGLRTAARIVKDLADAGLVIVSGLARGIDTVAHEKALESGTIAVQASGVDVIYPKENTELAQSIPQKGLRLSEQPMGQNPMARHFPARNRIVAALSQAVVVIEAAGRSGSLITAEVALGLGREVHAVPGHPFDARAAGCNRLIRDGALLVRGAEDILDGLATLPFPRSQPVSKAAPNPPPDPARQPQEVHQRILDHLSASPVSEDMLSRTLGITQAAMGAALADLELRGNVARAPGGLIALSQQT